MAVMYSSAGGQKAPSPHSSTDWEHETSVPMHLLHPSSCCSVAAGLWEGGVSQDHPDSHTSGSPLLTGSNTWHAIGAIHLATHRFGSVLEAPGLSLLRSLCTRYWVTCYLQPIVTVLNTGKASVQIRRAITQRHWRCDCLSHTSGGQGRYGLEEGI